MTIPLLIVGAGTIGRIHAAAAESTGRFRVTALVDRDPDAARTLAAELPRDVVVATAIDELPEGVAAAAAVATPSGDHAVSATSALDRGWHTLVEKPIDTDLPRARAFALRAREAAATGIVSTVVSQHRFDPASASLRSLLDRGELGRVTTAVGSLAWWRSQAYYDSAAWRGTWAMDGGGAVMNQGIHTLDLMIWLLGQPVQVSAAAGLLAHSGIEVEDTVAAVIRFASGALATFHATTTAYPGVGTRLMVAGDRGSAVIEDDDLVYLHTRSAAVDEVSPMGGGISQLTDVAVPTAVDATASHVGHARQYLDFAEAIETGSRPGVTVDEAVQTFATVWALYLSAQREAPVSIDDVLAGRLDASIASVLSGA